MVLKMSPVERRLVNGSVGGSEASAESGVSSIGSGIIEGMVAGLDSCRFSVGESSPPVVSCAWSSSNVGMADNGSGGVCPRLPFDHSFGDRGESALRGIIRSCLMLEWSPPPPIRGSEFRRSITWPPSSGADFRLFLRAAASLGGPASLLWLFLRGDARGLIGGCTGGGGDLLWDSLGARAANCSSKAPTKAFIDNFLLVRKLAAACMAELPRFSVPTPRASGMDIARCLIGIGEPSLEGDEPFLPVSILRPDLSPRDLLRPSPLLDSSPRDFFLPPDSALAADEAAEARLL
mmetsp:Transcript_142889/g.274370  ORF Transcript_142889/g.274370 Transcript_142889/m.274370 type:complete len:292 (-) Transcript_142889:1559-2434(-)